MRNLRKSFNTLRFNFYPHPRHETRLENGTATVSSRTEGLVLTGGLMGFNSPPTDPVPSSTSDLNRSFHSREICKFRWFSFFRLKNVINRCREKRPSTPPRIDRVKTCLRHCPRKSVTRQNFVSRRRETSRSRVDKVYDIRQSRCRCGHPPHPRVV